MCLEIQKVESIKGFLNEVKPSKSLHKNADFYRQLNAMKKLIEEKMEEIKPILLEAQVEEFFEDEKVIFQSGRVQSYLDNTIIIKEIGQKKFNEVATVTASALKESVDNADVVVALANVKLSECTKPSIKVAPLTRADKIRFAEGK